MYENKSIYYTILLYVLKNVIKNAKNEKNQAD